MDGTALVIWFTVFTHLASIGTFMLPLLYGIKGKSDSILCVDDVSTQTEDEEENDEVFDPMTTTIEEGSSLRLCYYEFDKRDERDLWITFEEVVEGHQNCCETLSGGLKTLRNFFPSVYDQGNLGSCTANAICGVFQFDEMMRYGMRLRKMNPSRLFLYYNERALHHTESSDSGASLRDGIKCASKYGICLENSWGYDVSKFTEKPPEHCYEEAKEQKAVQYYAVKQTVDQLTRCIDHDYAIVFGMVVFESFLDTKSDGLVSMPDFQKEKILGGHALVITGYDASRSVFEIRNSWGTEWGKEGYGYVPYEYILDRRYASDFWCLQQVENDFILPHRPLFSERSSVSISRSACTSK